MRVWPGSVAWLHALLPPIDLLMDGTVLGDETIEWPLNTCTEI